MDKKAEQVKQLRAFRKQQLASTLDLIALANFQFDDYLDVISAHLARITYNLSQNNPKFNVKTVSEIISKLLKRYYENIAKRQSPIIQNSSLKNIVDIKTLSKKQ